MDILDTGAIHARIREFIDQRSPSQIVTLNSLMYNCALEDGELAAAVSRAALVIPDSAGIVWAAKYIANQRVKRLPGIDLIQYLCRLAVESRNRIFLLGSQPGVAETAARKLEKQHPGLQIAGTHHGYFSEDEKELIETIKNAHPDILLVALAMPHQDKWIASHLRELNVPVVIGVGGSFDVIAGRLRRAPLWMQRCDIEWLFRLIQQPSRIFRMADLPIFLWNMVKLKRKAGGKR